MFFWDVTITTLIVSAAAYYVAHNIYKTVKGATKGCSGCCSACSHCNLASLNTGVNLPLQIRQGQKKFSDR